MCRVGLPPPREPSGSWSVLPEGVKLSLQKCPSQISGERQRMDMGCPVLCASPDAISLISHRQRVVT